MHSHPLLWDSRADSFLHDCFDAELHKKTLRSVRDAVLGTLASARAGVAHIGRGLAQARGLRPKHAIKQVDRLLSNHRLDLEALAPSWLGFVVGNRTDIVIAFDWTDFAKDDQSTLALSVHRLIPYRTLMPHSMTCTQPCRTPRSQIVCERRSVSLGMHATDWAMANPLDGADPHDVK